MNPLPQASPLKSVWSPTKIPTWLGLVLCLLLVLIARPYEGLRADGDLYIAEVLRRFHPGLNADLYFAHGSQGKYSIYVALMAPLYQVLSIETVQLLVLGAALVLSAIAVHRLLRELGPTQAWFGLFCLLAMNSNYGGMGLMRFFENFLTARTLAEPLVLWGLVFVLEGRRAWAILSLLLAAAFHPLIALPAWVIAWLELQRADKRWRWALLAVPVALVLALSGVAPFDGLLHRYDPDWWERVRIFDAHTVLANWLSTDWQRILVDGLVLWAASLWVPRRLAGLARSTLVATIVLLAISVLGADLMHNQLLTALQPWRVLWLEHLLALGLLPSVLAQLWQREPRWGLWRLAALLVATGCVAADGSWAYSWGILVLAGLVIFAARRQVPVSPMMLRFAAVAAVLCMLGLSTVFAIQGSHIWRGNYFDSWPSPLWILFLQSPELCLSLAYAVIRLWQGPSSWRFAAMLGLSLLIVATATKWDLRSDWVKLLERGGMQRDLPFDRIIPPDAQVYWHQELRAPWVLLGRPSYFADGQGAGQLFNEGTSIDFTKRWLVFKDVMAQTFACRLGAALTKRPEAQCITPSAETVRGLCLKSPRLDYLIFRAPLGGVRGTVPAPLSTWNPKLPSQPDLNFYLYGCNQFR